MDRLSQRPVPNLRLAWQAPNSWALTALFNLLLALPSAAREEGNNTNPAQENPVTHTAVDDFATNPTLAPLREETDTPLPSLPRPPETLSEDREAVRRAIEEAFEEAREKPNDAAAVGDYGEVFHANGYYREAVQCYFRAAGLEPSSFRWNYLLGLACFEGQRPKSAAAPMLRAAELDRDWAPAWYYLGEALLARENPEAAARAYQRAIEASAFYDTTMLSWPEPSSRSVSLSAYAAARLGRLLAAEGKTDEAVELIAQHLERYQYFRPLHESLARIYLFEGKNDLARIALAAAGDLPREPVPADSFRDEILLRSSSVEVLIREINRVKLTGNVEWVKVLARRAVETDPGHPVAAVQLGLVLLGDEKVETALKLLHTYRRSALAEPIVLEKVGRKLVEHGFNQEAILFLSDAVRSRPDSAHGHYHLGLALRENGNSQDSVDHMAEAVQLSPEDLDIRFEYAITLFLAERFEEARHQFEFVLEEDPGAALAAFYLGDIMVLTQDKSKAEDYYRQTLELNPDLYAAQKRLNALANVDARSEAQMKKVVQEKTPRRLRRHGGGGVRRDRVDGS